MKALALWVAAAATILLLAATSTQLGWAVQRRVLLQQPRVGADMGAAPRPPTPIRPASSLGAKRSPGRVEGPRTMLELPSEGAAARYRAAYQLCRGPDKGAPPLPKLKRAVGWPGEDPTRDGNTTIVTSLHVEQLPLLEVHCAVWPHKIAAAVYAPLSATGHVACAEELGTEAGLKKAGSWMAWLGLRSGACPYAGWSLARLKQHVRAAQRRAQKTGLCNLAVELYTEAVSPELGPAAALLPAAALQNRALQLLEPEKAAEHHAVVLLDGDMVSVDIWQLVNWPSRWARAVREMQEGQVLVLPGFQLSPEGAAVAQLGGGRRGLYPELEVLQEAVNVVTAEAGKFPLMDLFRAGRAQVLQDRGFAGSQDAALPDTVWFEAGDMHGEPDDGYPVLPRPGFAPFAFMLQRHVPWADERLRGAYYQRAWAALAARALGLRHAVQPNAFAMQLPHAGAYSRSEAALAAFNAMEPVFRQLAAEVARGGYVPVTSFASKCAAGGDRVVSSA